MTDISEGPELDLAVAEACRMNATIYYNHELSKNVCLLLPSEKAFLPSSDLNDAFRAAEEVRVINHYRMLRMNRFNWEIYEVADVGDPDRTISNEETPALAICAAILVLFETNKEALKHGKSQ